MSSQVTTAIETARSLVNTRAYNNFLDNQRRAFLDKLHVAAQPLVIRGNDGTETIKRPKVRLTDWETQFVASHVAKKRPFTDAIRKCIDELREEHERLC